MNRLILSIVATAMLFTIAADAADMEITPFMTVNQSPVVQIFGLPYGTSAEVAPAGRLEFVVSQDIASNYSASSNARERIILDGEYYKWTISARYGIAGRYDVGMDIPYLLQGGGFLDGTIIDWHRAFGLPQGGREEAPKGRLLYSYRKDGVQKLSMSSSGSGIGDIRLTGGASLYESKEGESHDNITLRASLKLPSGDSEYLRGSGSTDLALFFCGSMNNATEWGTLGVFGSAGGMAMTNGDVLRDQQENIVGFGTLGLGWGPASWISFKFQLNATTPFYRGSSLDELSKSSFQLISGGAVKLPGNYRLDIGVSEDVAVSTAPDVAFHLGLSRRF